MNSIFLSDKKNILKIFLVVCLLVCMATGFGIYINTVISKIPEDIYVVKDDEAVVDLRIPATGICEASGGVTKVDFNAPVTFKGNVTGTYELNIRLFDLFDIRTVDVNVVNERSIYPCGFQIGMYLKTDGVLVVDTGEFEDYAGNKVNPCDNILKPGDYIVKINRTEVTSKTELNKRINAAKGEKVVLNVRRDGELIDVSINPVLTKDGDYKAGLWVKDDAQGIGTITYVTDDGRYGALGHGVSDPTVGKLMEISAGSIYKTKILSIVKGENGDPGEFIGTINYSDNNKFGTITSNSISGITGRINADLIEIYSLNKIPIGYSYEVHKGKAFIRLYNEGSYKDYEIEIQNVKSGNNKNITYKVVSQELLDLTNGIVQGMSGCPIIQDGKLIGAVTHVFIDDCTSGYGIFVENMLKH